MRAPVIEHTLNNACIISSTGVSLNWPFRYLPIAVRFAKVTTTSSGRFSKIAARPCATCVDMVRTVEMQAVERSVDTNMEDSSNKRLKSDSLLNGSINDFYPDRSHDERRKG